MDEADLEGDALREQRAHNVANVLGALHNEGLSVDAEMTATAQRFVDGEAPLSELTSLIAKLRKDDS
jgi:hypothetical protein